MLSITINPTLKVRVAPLPVVSLSFEYLVQIWEPVGLVPEKISIFEADYIANSNSTSTVDMLKAKILALWQDRIKDLPDDHYFKKIDKVELIECDLLVPKYASPCVVDCDGGGCISCKD